MLTVTFKNVENNETISGTFQTYRTASNHAKWLATQVWASSVRIMNQVGGIQV